MKSITLLEANDLLTTATITETIDSGIFITHKGVTSEGMAFLLVNGMNGETIITQL